MTFQLPFPDPTATPFGYVAPPTATPAPPTATALPAFTPTVTTIPTLTPTSTASPMPTLIPTWTPDPRWPTPEPVVIHGSSGLSQAQSAGVDLFPLLIIGMCLVLLLFTAVCLWRFYYQPRA